MIREKVIYINVLLRTINNDSKKVSKAALKDLNVIGEEYFTKIYEITKEIGYDYFDNYNLGDVEFGFKDKNLLYFNLWNSCKEDCDQKSVSIEELSNPNYIKFAKKIKQKQIEYLNKAIAYNKQELIQNENKLKILQNND